jgi:hypothetical protein
MKALGSKGGYFDPIPPDQHAWPMMLATNPGINVFRLWSWMCAHTIRKGRRKGYVCDERGRPLSVEDAAVDLKMDPGVCRRAWRDGFALGLWRKGTNAADKRQLFLNAKVVPVPAGLEEEQGDQESQEEDDSNTEKGEEKAKLVCTDLFPPYLRLQIKRLPKAKRKNFETEYERNERLYKDVHADVTVAVRLIFDQRENTIFDKFGIKKIREEHKPKNGAAKSPVRVKLVQEFLPGLEKFVQTFEERSVQTSDGSVQTSETPVVQTVEKPEKGKVTPATGKASGDGSKRAVLESQRTSLRGTSPSMEDSIPAAASLKNAAADSTMDMEALIIQELSVDGDAARRLVAGCRAAEKTITAPEIVALAAMKLHAAREQIRKGKIHSVTGLLIKHVPTMCTGVDLQNVRTELRREEERKAERIAYVRDNWQEFDADEQQRALDQFPELAREQGVAGD